MRNHYTPLGSACVWVWPAQIDASLLQVRNVGLAVKIGDVVQVVACPCVCPSAVVLTPSLATKVVIGLQHLRAYRIAGGYDAEQAQTLRRNDALLWVWVGHCAN